MNILKFASVLGAFTISGFIIGTCYKYELLKNSSGNKIDDQIEGMVYGFIYGAICLYGHMAITACCNKLSKSENECAKSVSSCFFSEDRRRIVYIRDREGHVLNNNIMQELIAQNGEREIDDLKIDDEEEKEGFVQLQNINH